MKTWFLTSFLYANKVHGLATIYESSKQHIVLNHNSYPTDGKFNRTNEF